MRQAIEKLIAENEKEIECDYGTNFADGMQRALEEQNIALQAILDAPAAPQINERGKDGLGDAETIAEVLRGH